MEIRRRVFSVRDFISWGRSGSLDLTPSFQRRSVWKPKAKSFLIDTLIRDLPVPILFIRQRVEVGTIEPIREVVDGQQRLRTVLAYIEPGLIKDFDEATDRFTILRAHNPELAGQRFLDLPEEASSALLDYEFSVHVMSEDTSDAEVLEVFARLNATGTKLESQELRNAAYYGEFKTSMYSLALQQLNRWRSWKLYNEGDIARMREVEGTSDLVLLIMGGIQARSSQILDSAYLKFDDAFPDRVEVERRFQDVMDAIDDTLGARLADSIYSRTAVFYSLFALYYEYMFGLGSALTRRSRRRRLPSGMAESLMRASDELRSADLPDEVSRAFRGATAHAGTRRVRYEWLKRAVEGEAE